MALGAGLRLAPGSARPVFDQDIWDLSGLGDAPVIMGTHRKILDFTQITNPRWRLVARQYLLARMAPGHPAIATLPHAIRSPLNPNSLWTALKHLAGWFNHLTDAGVDSLTEVTQAHCDGYLQAVSYGVGSGRRLSPATLTMAVRAPQMLALYGEILDQHYRDGFTPWAGRGPDVVAGYQRPFGNRVPPVPDTLLRPLLADTLYLVNTIAPLLAAEVAAARAAISGKPLHANTFRHGSSACCARRSAPAPPATSRHRSWRRAHSPGACAAAGTRKTRCCTWPGTPWSSKSSARWATDVTWNGCGPNWKRGWPAAASNNPGDATRQPWHRCTATSRSHGRCR